ncbi:glycosyltransferase [Halochromatium salexigens]|uniref:Glycosyl transferase n=1 Tax=Halochromatium salexigens TaxID=49447 RepID=A0AAJ0XF97_HALSE|nr:glycosyltransferase [Halochromatium salexigens]MBK5929447.1 glycosyl transferase [Halochromatium salexigens]
MESSPSLCPRVAVLIPCLNEEASIATVVRDFRALLPTARVYVYDNHSSDRTAAVAAEAGAIVRHEERRGKGHVVCRMFSEVEADLYLLVDGDGTYDPVSASTLIERLTAERLDMVCGARVERGDDAYRLGHRFGNQVLTGLIAALFGHRFRDMLTGYRVFTRRFVKSFPMLSDGFEIETQLSVHALQMRLRVAELETPYCARPADSPSKLRTVRDGLRILRTIGMLVKEERPLWFFSILFALLASGSILLAVPIMLEFMQTGLVPRFPTAILATGMMLLGFLLLTSGLVLDSVAHGRRELKRLHYLALPPYLSHAIPRRPGQLPERGD